MDITAIEAAYQNAHGAWTGCEWTTSHGNTQLDLDGADADQIRALLPKLKAMKTTDDEFDTIPTPHWESGDWDDVARAQEWELYLADLESAADWLDECSGAAECAEDAGLRSVEAARNGHMEKALA